MRHLETSAMQLQLDPRLDPREWKKEHQVALVGAISLGCLIGLIFAANTVEFYSNWWSNLGSDISEFYYSRRIAEVVKMLFWTVFGGLFGGSLVYITQLLRK
jgi:hypothetical protein